MTKSSHILVLPHDSTPGKTYIIGDVHGSALSLQAVLNQLNPEDILVILGDLIDRGESAPGCPTSAEVLELIISYNNAPIGTKPKIYAIQGNHERLFLEIMNIFDRLKNGERVPDEYLLAVVVFIKNGGEWIFKHDTKDSLKRLLVFRSFALGEKSPPYLAYINKALNEIFAEPDKHLIPNLDVYRNLIKSLPFVIKIDGKYPVLCAHSDLNISDADIDRKIVNQEDFTYSEIKYMTSARVNEFNSKGVRNSSSRLVMVGHNPIDDKKRITDNPVLAVREDTNHVNLDGGAYFSNGFLLLDIVDLTVAVVGENISDKDKSFLSDAQQTIQLHLNKIKCNNEIEKPSEDDEYTPKRRRFM